LFLVKKIATFNFVNVLELYQRMSGGTINDKIKEF
jgi:hypothetical protein